MDVEHFTEAEVAYALRRSHGRTYRAAAKLGVDARTIQRYKKRYPGLQEVCKEARGRIVDFAEGKLWQAIKLGEPWAIRFFLSTIGKRRGYSEDHQGKTQVNIGVQVNQKPSELTEKEAEELLSLLEQARQRRISRDGNGHD